MGAKHSGSATTVFARKVERGQHEQYEEWLRIVSRATSGVDGYRETTIIRSATDQAEYVVIVQFDTSKHLDLWLKSDERNRCLDHLVRGSSFRFHVGARLARPNIGLRSFSTEKAKAVDRCRM